ncbi:glycosyltransferase family 4 protein [Desulfatiglans anilini]|uniref:glycosyltransferase family 4 protein n=1 Tax=Desulfatiglans anilini TaxID=90728 RepID=UPI0003FFB67F|nr:glycosyltransferase family 4 protein [Desulfatiglans anilini]
MKILLLSRYGPLGASSRIRSFQYLPYLTAHGMSVHVSPLFSDAYLQALYSASPTLQDALYGYANRVRVVLSAHRFDVTIIEKEIFPFLPAWTERLFHATNVPYLADYDDAIFHRYDQHPHAFVRRFLRNKIDVVMLNASMVIAGNEYLAERARKAGAARVMVIPTVVDTDRYYPRNDPTGRTPVVGWIGTPKTSRYLKRLLPVFKALKRETPVRFIAVGALPEDFTGTPVETWPWSLQTEVSSIQKFDIGIMPIDNTPWERGKCGYKLIQYMACGLPVVASPVGVNCEIVSKESGFLAETDEEWHLTLKELLKCSAEERQTMGALGRKIVDEWYSLRIQGPRFVEALRKVIH